jgi:hypothetical protein
LFYSETFDFLAALNRPVNVLFNPPIYFRVVLVIPIRDVVYVSGATVPNHGEGAVAVSKSVKRGISITSLRVLIAARATSMGENGSHQEAQGSGMRVGSNFDLRLRFVSHFNLYIL